MNDSPQNPSPFLRPPDPSLAVPKPEEQPKPVENQEAPVDAPQPVQQGPVQSSVSAETPSLVNENKEVVQQPATAELKPEVEKVEPKVETMDVKPTEPATPSPKEVAEEAPVEAKSAVTQSAQPEPVSISVSQKKETVESTPKAPPAINPPAVKKEDNSLDESNTNLKEVKYSLNDMLAEVDDERQASSMARQIIDQQEIQKMLEDRKKKLKKEGKL